MIFRERIKKEFIKGIKVGRQRKSKIRNRLDEQFSGPMLGSGGVDKIYFRIH